jgi:membrane fusion protein (multidrug efflux system)
LRNDVANGRLKLSGPNRAKVTLFLEDGTQYSEAGTLQFTDITVDQGTGSVTVRALFPNPRFVLLPGMFVRARIEEGVDETALLVPEVGVTHDPNGRATALVVGSDNRVTMHPLQLRGTSANRWIVTDGLQDGDRVIVAGLQKVQAGALVQAVESQSAPTAEAASARLTSAPMAPPDAKPAARRPVVAQAK